MRIFGTRVRSLPGYGQRSSRCETGSSSERSPRLTLSQGQTVWSTQQGSPGDRGVKEGEQSRCIAMDRSNDGCAYPPLP